MKKVLGTMAGFIFGAFGIGIIALLMTLTYQALGHIFPDSFENQMWGMIVFDVAVLCWAAAFIFKSKSVAQYAAAGVGFIIALLGTLGMVAAEVIIGGQTLVAAQAQQIGQWMVYGFIFVTVLHVIMLWVHHGAEPDIWAQIDLGISKSQVVDTARKQATSQIEKEQAMLANSLAEELVSQIKRDLNIPIAVTSLFGKELDPPKQNYEQAIPHPTITPQDEQSTAQPPFPGTPSE